MTARGCGEALSTVLARAFNAIDGDPIVIVRRECWPASDVVLVSSQDLSAQLRGAQLDAKGTVDDSTRFVYQPTLEDLIVDDWTEVERGR